MRKPLAILLVAVCASGFITLTSCGQPTTPNGSAAKDGKQSNDREPQPEELLRSMADYLGSLPAFSCRVETKTHLQTPEGERQFSSDLRLQVERPNRVSLSIEEGDTRMKVLSDGRELVQYSQASNRYVVSDAPADLAAFAAMGEDLGMGTIARYLPTTGDELYKALTDGLRRSEYVGQEKIGDILCHRCRFVQENVTWEIWIEASDRPLVHRAVLDLSNLLTDSAGNKLRGAKLEHAVMFSDWKIAPKFFAADFAFDPPEGAQQVESLFGGEEAPHPLVGQAAPAFTTVDSNGRPIDLKQHLGKNVILLDFWATWCGPCIVAMPEVAAVAKKYANRGLVFYAVNSAEDVATVKDFIKQTRFNARVAMDPNGEVSQSYMVEFLPQTVLVGKDGKVQIVHLGFSDDLTKQLSAEIEALLAGKDLTGETQDNAEKASN